MEGNCGISPGFSAAQLLGASGCRNSCWRFRLPKRQDTVCREGYRTCVMTYHSWCTKVCLCKWMAALLRPAGRWAEQRHHDCDFRLEATVTFATGHVLSPGSGKSSCAQAGRRILNHQARAGDFRQVLQLSPKGFDLM